MRLQSYFQKWTVGSALGLGAAFLTGLLVSSGAPFLAAPGGAAGTNAAVAARTAPVVPGPAPTSYADAVDRAAPAVVTIQVEKQMAAMQGMQGVPDDFLQRFFGGDAPQTRRGQPRQAPQMEHGLGSGVIVSADGNILTNNHVVDGSQTVKVTLPDGRDFTAKVVGKDPQADLAVVHIDARNLPVLTLADSDRVRVGDVVLAVGNPLGVGQTVTMGIISAKGRRTDASADGSYENFLQTDAPINQGNSGGALITTTGELVGINSQIMSSSGGSIGIGFAIPSNMAKDVMTQLMATGHVRRGLLGVTAQGVTSDLAQSLNLPSVHGAIVSELTPDGPAAKAGLKTGDVILKVNGTAIDDSNDLRNRISAMAPGATVTLDVQRDGAARTISAKLEEKRDGAEAVASEPAKADSALGLSVEALSPALAQRYEVPKGVTGVIVTNVDAQSAAGRAGLQAGDVIRTVNGVAIGAASDLSRAVEARKDRPALAYVQRGASAFYVAIPQRP